MNSLHVTYQNLYFCKQFKIHEIREIKDLQKFGTIL